MAKNRFLPPKAGLSKRGQLKRAGRDLRVPLDRRSHRDTLVDNFRRKKLQKIQRDESLHAFFFPLEA